jgi:hypothetical protein
MELSLSDLTHPFAPHRSKFYAVLLSFVGAVFVFMTVAVGTGLVAPSLAVDVAANLIFGTPVIVLPFVLLWKVPGETRSRLALAAELSMVYIPLTAGSQPNYELPFLIGIRSTCGELLLTPAGAGCGGSTGWPTRVTAATTTSFSACSSERSSPECCCSWSG